METSRDWGNEFQETLKWLLITFAITAVVFVVILAVLFVTTRWGRQFWHLSRGFFTGAGAWKNIGFVALLLLSAAGAVRVNVLISYQSNDMFTALQNGAEAIAKRDSDALHVAEHAFWQSMLVFAIIAAIHVVRSLLDYYIGAAFEVRWRVWLTDKVGTDWLSEHADYRGRFIDDTIDNPDQRVQEDITTYVQQSRDLSTGAVTAVITVVSFTQILWDLSGPLTLLGVEIPRAMMFLVLMYVLLATVIAFWIGRPLIRINFLYQRATASFRYALVRVRDNAESIAFYRGENVEHRGLVGWFAGVIKTYWRLIYRTLGFSGWNLSVNQTAVVFPWMIQAPRFFAGKVTLGGIQQTASAFGNIHDSLSFFRENYSNFASYRAALIRLDGLQIANRQSRELPTIAVADLADAVELDGIEVRRPDGGVLIEGLDLRLVPGDALVVKGASGSGKTTLLRTLAELWPYGAGEFRRPAGNDTLFLSQIPYLPLGDLRTVVSYPAEPGDFADETLRDVLNKVHLGHIADRLDETADWAKILSPGEQQRIAFARILLIRPKAAFLDEATSAVDEGLEHSLYTLVRTEAPETILVSVAHRSTVDRFHTRRLDLAGGGPWTTGDIEVPA
jgi:vitamin B12/bleomycin/antimicrobial peptide transport system ATP-binding/permease protein